MWGVLVAVAITTAMDATGYASFSALILFPLLCLFWYLQRFSREAIGLLWGDSRSYLLAALYPVAVLTPLVVVALAAGAVDTADADWQKTFVNVALMSSVGIIMGLLTEEGFFRGWLWASLRASGMSDYRVLLWTSLAFTGWHLSAVLLDTGFDLPLAEVPIYLVNATLLGAIWGMLRLLSGSVVVPSVSHALWNGLVYPLFGFGESTGALGIEQTHWYGPEVGLLGIVFNLGFAAGLVLLVRRHLRARVT
jgi:membrane protease YdiL (CAAX protease family)